MSVYASNKWGDTDSNDRACIGLWFYEESNTATSYTFRADAWIWTKWAIHDSDNSWYWDRKRGSAPAATTKYASRDIYTTVSSGSGWSTSNQQKIDSGTYTYTKEHSAYYIYIRIYLDGVATTGSYMAHNGWVQIPAKSSYTVSYNANGGSGAPGSQTKWYGETLTLSSTKPTRTGYTFKGWATSSGGGVAYASGASYTANSGATLYAVWSINTWQVTYNGNGATSGVPSAQTKVYGQTLTLSSNTPARSGYIFRDWSGSNGTIYARGASYTTNAALTLTARWKYTVTYNANGGTGAPTTQETPMGSATTLSTSKPVRDNYTFKNWLGSDGTSYNPGASYTGASLTLTAQWWNHYSITYNANGGSGAPSTQTKVQNTAIALSTETPTRENYRFTGWNTADDGTGTAYASGASYATDAPLNLYAQWQILYIAPTIGPVTAYRCDSSGVLSDEGTRGFISFDWSVDRTVYSDNVGKTVSITYKQRGSSGNPTTISGIPALPSQQSGTFSFITGSIFNTDYTYDLVITLNDDGHGSQSVTDFISLAYYIVDFKEGGHGIGFGGTADEDLMKVYMESKFVGAVSGTGILDYVYPVGSIYMSVNSTSPATLFGGTWEQLKDRFLLAAGDTYTAGATGGSATTSYTPGGTVGNTTLTAAQSGVPAHSHGFSLTAASKTLTGDISPYGDTGLLSGSYKVSGIVAKGANTFSSYKLGYASGSSYSMKIDASHSHSVTGSISNNTAANASSAHNHGWTGTAANISTMSPYLAVYMWKRTS